jgi:hypothetical protein
MAFALLQGLTRTGPPLARLPLLGFLAPTAHQVADSDLRRAYLTRLCSAYTLSQRPGALLRPRPFRFCFTPVALMGFALQRLPLPTCRSVSRRPRPSWRLGQHLSQRPPAPLPEGRSAGTQRRHPSPSPLPASSCCFRTVLRRVPPNQRSDADGSNASSGVQAWSGVRSSDRRGLAARLEPILSWVFSPPGSSPFLPWHDLRRASSLVLPPPRLPPASRRKRPRKGTSESQ